MISYYEVDLYEISPWQLFDQNSNAPVLCRCKSGYMSNHCWAILILYSREKYQMHNFKSLL